MGIENGDNFRTVEEAEEVAEGGNLELEVTPEQMEGNIEVAKEQQVEQETPEPSLRSLEDNQNVQAGFNKQEEIKQKLVRIKSIIQSLIQNNDNIPRDFREVLQQKMVNDNAVEQIDDEIQERIEFIRERRRFKIFRIGQEEIQALERLRESIKPELTEYSNLKRINFIPQTIEKTPFADTPAQKFFIEWCRINDSIVPEFISREDWEKRGIQGILKKNDQGKQTLFLPTDLHLWEMMDIIKTIDADTLSRKPEKIEERAQKIQELGVVFEKAGLYLEEYNSDLSGDDEKSIAQAIANEFYNYGLSLQNRELEIEGNIEKLVLTEEDKTKLDEWFLGGNVYQKRLARLGDNPKEEQIEDIRKKLLQVYFNTLTREGYKAEGEKPWETKIGPIQNLQDTTKRGITKAIETPEREMKTAIFRRGIEKLVTEMKAPNWKESIQTFLEEGYDLDIATEKVKLINILELPKLKDELDEIRRGGDISTISSKELEIAKKIQQAVSSFTYKLSANNPSEMLETQFINCLGSSILGGGLLEEVGIRYLSMDLPEHSATVLITSNGKVYWQDFTPPNGSNLNYVEVSPDMLDGDVDIFKLTSITDNSLPIEFKNLEINNKKIRVNLFNPEMGLQLQVLNNAGSALLDLGKKEKGEESVEFYQQAIEAYQQAINIDPKYADPYMGFGEALSLLGRKEEAIEAYQKFISLWNGYTYPIHLAKVKIEELKQKE